MKNPVSTDGSTSSPGCSASCVAVVLAAALILTSCGALRRDVTIWATRPLIFSSMDALMSETDLELAKTAMEANLKLLDGLLEVDPDNRELLTLAAQGYTGYALMFVEDENPARAGALYQRAKNLGLRALAQRGRAFLKGDFNARQLAGLTKRLKEEDIPAAYWTAAAWSSSISLDRTSPASVAELPRALGLMQWVYDREPAFFHSAPRWFFGAYYASVSPMFGGDVDKSKEYFQEALKAEGDNFLLGKVMMARSVAVQTLDRELYVKLLEETLTGAPDEPPDLRLMNRVAQIKARAALLKVDDVFD